MQMSEKASKNSLPVCTNTVEYEDNFDVIIPVEGIGYCIYSSPDIPGV